MPRLELTLKPLLFNLFENWLERSGLEYKLIKKVTRSGIHITLLLKEGEPRVDKVSSFALKLGAYCDLCSDVHLSPFHADLGDVPFDGINGCESPFE